MKNLPLSLLIVSLWLSQACVAAVATEPMSNIPPPFPSAEPKPVAPIPVQVVAEDITALVLLSEQQPLQAKQQLAALLAKRQRANISNNIAENYLLAVVRAHIALSERQYQAAIDALIPAQQSSHDINPNQLSSPEFAQLHQLLATSYAAVGDFKQAFVQKKAFLKKYRAYHKEQKRHTIAALSEKYKMDLKEKENELLEKQNRLEAVKIEDSEQEKSVAQRNMILLVAIASVFILLLLRQIRVRRKLKKLNERDSLTQLLNRKVLFDKGDQLYQQAQQSKQPLSVCIFDIDYFKAINDNYGHQVGDQVLVKVAKLGNETMRSRDIFARLGGEEFVALLPDASIDEAKAIAERLREKLLHADFGAQGLDQQVSASFGVATLADDIRSFDEFLHCADKAMYQAKAQGRNRVLSYDSILAAND